MKLLINYYKSFKLKPTYKFFLNLFFIKNMNIYKLKQLQYISVFTALTKILKVKIFKFNYYFYFNFIIFFVVINILIQLLLFLI